MNSLASYITSKFPNAVHRDSNGQDVIYLAKEDYKQAAIELKENCDVVMCLDVTVADYLGTSDRIHVEGVAAERFEVVAQFISHKRNERIRLIVQVNDHEAHVDTLADIFPGVNFGEREAYDMFGVVFDGHPDLTRILMPEEWEGYPLRKDDSSARIPVNFTDDLPKGEQAEVGEFS